MDGLLEQRGLTRKARHDLIFNSRGRYKFGAAPRFTPAARDEDAGYTFQAPEEK